MKTFLLGSATLALALAITPASAQLLGGGGGVSGGLGGSLGGVTGSGVGSLGGTIERGPLRTDNITSTRASNRTSKNVDVRKGRVGVSQDISANSTLDGATRAGDRSLTASGAGGGSASGSADAQLLGTDAVRDAAGRGVGTGRGVTDNARSAVRDSTAGAVDRASSAVGGAAGGVAGSGSAAGSGGVSAAGRSLSGSGNLALAGSGMAQSGAFPVNSGMAVTDARGRAIGTVQSVRSATNGAVQRVLVRVGNRIADLPATNFSGSGSVLVSAMGKGDVKHAAAQ